MARAYTQYWKYEQFDWQERPDEPLTGAGSNQFRARGVQPGDRIFVVSLFDAKVYLGGVLVVDKLLGLRDARRLLGKDVWEASDTVVARDPQPFYTDLRVPMNTVRALRFVGDKKLVFKTPGKLDIQTLRGVRELTNESAAVLQELLDAHRSPKRKTEKAPDLTRIAPHFGKELVLELEILQRADLSETEKQSLIVARRGQGIFRDKVLGVELRCRVTGIDDRNYLIASHIKPWSECSDAERLSENNGLMLAPHVDHLFDGGLISFKDNGDLLVAPTCSAAVLTAWGISPTLNVGKFRTAQLPFLTYHREHCFRNSKPE